MFDEAVFDKKPFNGNAIYGETNRQMAMVFTGTEKDSAIRAESRNLAMVFTGVEKNSAIWRERLGKFSMSASFKPFTMRQDTLAEGVINIKKPQKGQLEVIAE